MNTVLLVLPEDRCWERLLGAARAVGDLVAARDRYLLTSREERVWIDGPPAAIEELSEDELLYWKQKISNPTFFLLHYRGDCLVTKLVETLFPPDWWLQNEFGHAFSAAECFSWSAGGRSWVNARPSSTDSN